MGTPPRNCESAPLSVIPTLLRWKTGAKSLSPIFPYGRTHLQKMLRAVRSPITKPLVYHDVREQRPRASRLTTPAARRTQF
jgi:hypothetical protein